MKKKIFYFILSLIFSLIFVSLIYYLGPKLILSFIIWLGSEV